MKKVLFTLSLCLLAIACDYSNNENPETGIGTYILNNGSWGDNNSCIGVYKVQDKSYTPNAFNSANGFRLGDLAQDILVVNEEVYIAVYGSQTIFVTDLSLKVKNQINVDKNGVRLSPRYLTASKDRVFVSYYEGFVGEINPKDYSVKVTEVGQNPEGLAVAGSNLYVANSGGLSYPVYDNTISVVSLGTFKETKRITVNPNPAKVVASSNGNYLYVFSYGDYDAAPALLQLIDVASSDVSTLEYSSVSGIAKGNNDILYILCGGYDQMWNPLPGTVFKHDMNKNKAMGSFISDATEVPDAYSISATSDGYVYVGSSDYVNTGDMYVFSQDGKLHSRFDTQGLNPVSAI